MTDILTTEPCRQPLLVPVVPNTLMELLLLDSSYQVCWQNTLYNSNNFLILTHQIQHRCSCDTIWLLQFLFLNSLYKCCWMYNTLNCCNVNSIWQIFKLTVYLCLTQQPLTEKKRLKLKAMTHSIDRNRESESESGGVSMSYKCSRWCPIIFISSCSVWRGRSFIDFR